MGKGRREVLTHGGWVMLMDGHEEEYVGPLSGLARSPILRTGFVRMITEKEPLQS